MITQDAVTKTGHMKLQAEPLVALADEKVDISISGLAPFAQVKLSASLCLPWAKDVPFQSFAVFTADSGGNVELSKQKPDSGTYDFIDSMGLIVSVRSEAKNAIEKIGQNISVNESIFIAISAECGQDRAAVRLERLFKSPAVKSQRISDEFVGELFSSGNADDPVVVFLGGSGSGLAVNSPIAALLASHGFNVLSVAYFGDKGLPAKLSEVPLEYFERVFAWLANHALTRGKAVSILGQSKGAELSLLLASRYPIVKRLALFAPHAYCFQGIAFKNVSSWTYQGRPLPFIQLKNLWLFESMIGAFLRNQPFQFTTTYRKGLSAAKNKEAARIKVENAQADLLMFATGQNGMWNTDEGCAVIMDALRKANYPHQYDLVVHEGAGEPFPVPYVIPAGETTVRMGPRLALSVGGSVEANVHAQADFWARSIEFLKSKS